MPEEEKSKPLEAKREKRINCVKCNKALRRVRRYYRNGKYYCNKKCWKAATTTAKK